MDTRKVDLKVDASRTNRSLYVAVQGGSQRPQLTPDLPLLYYRRQIEVSVAGAKKTRHGLPTDTAIADRDWIERRTAESDKDGWPASFEAACHWLELDAEAERKRLLAEIDDAVTREIVLHAGSIVYQRRAAVLTCMGVPTRVGRQYVLGLVALEDYEQLALLDEAPKRKHRRLPAARRQRPALPSTPTRAPRPRPGRTGGGASAHGSSPEVAACG